MKKLLLIDDNVDVVEVLFDSFMDLFDLVDTAYDVDEACRLIGLESYELIILDINLCNRNGAEIIKFITDGASNPNKQTPVIILSGIITPQFIDKFQARFSAIFLKPFDQLVLRARVNAILNTNKPKLSGDEEPSSSQEIADMHCAGPFSVDALKEQVDQVMVHIKKNTKLKQLFKQAQIDRNADKYILTHVNLIINISAAICAKMDWASDKSLEKFVYAAYLHDMALSARPDLAHINTLDKLESLRSKLSEEEYRIVFDHPNIAVKMIAEISEIPPDVDIIIKQHHETANERGFPNGHGYQKITPFSAVFIVAHNLADYIIENPKWTMEEFIKINRSRLHGSHFTKIVRSLSDMK